MWVEPLAGTRESDETPLDGVVALVTAGCGTMASLTPRRWRPVTLRSSTRADSWGVLLWGREWAAGGLAGGLVCGVVRGHDDRNAGAVVVTVVITRKHNRRDCRASAVDSDAWD